MKRRSHQSTCSEARQTALIATLLIAALLVTDIGDSKADELVLVPQAKASPVNLIGTWSGDNSTCGTLPCPMTVDIKRQTGKFIRGNFDITTDEPNPPMGKMHGKVIGVNVSMVLQSTVGDHCAAQATATLSNNNLTMTGQFQVSTVSPCNGRIVTFMLDKM